MKIRQARLVAVISMLVTYTFLPEIALFYLHKLISSLLSVISSHRLELFVRASALILF